MDLGNLAALIGYAVVVLAAFRRHWQFGVFALIILGFPTGGGIALRDELGWFSSAVPVLSLLADAHFFALLMAQRLRPWPFRFAVSIPGLWFTAGSFLALPWILASAIGLPPWGASIPYVLAAVGVVQSLWTREETLDVHLDNDRDAGELKRWPTIVTKAGADPAARPLKIVQITDPHLGPFMSVARLQRICERAVQRDPDLILLTGDIMTMESHDVGLVTEALAPRAKARGRVFACHGNHDLEAREVVRQAYARHGVRLLVDESELVNTPAGPVQIVGADYVWRGRQAHLAMLCDEHPRVPGALRIVLLHDPGAFRQLPPGQGDLVLSGHTHGGQVGLVSLGLKGTFVSMVSSIPDHGMWARGRDRLYVHRAQGVYGFPVRLGVPGEQSLLRVHRG